MRRGRRARARACERKVKHASLAGALIARKRQGLQDELEPYRCQWCGGWHLGHTRAGWVVKMGKVFKRISGLSGLAGQGAWLHKQAPLEPGKRSEHGDSRASGEPDRAA